MEEDGTIRLPQEVTDTFGLKEGDEFMVLGEDKKGIAIVKADLFKSIALKILESMGSVGKKDEDSEEDD